MKLKAIIKNLDNRIIEFEDSIKVEDLLKQVKDELPYPVYLAKLDNAYRSLAHITEHGCEVEFLDLRNQEAWWVYQNSLILIFIKAVHDVFGKKTLVTVNNSLNKGLYITSSHKFSEEDVKLTLNRMRQIVEADLPIVKEHLTKEGARILARKQKLVEVNKLLDSITNIDDIEIYSLEDEIQIFYNLLVPSTGYITLFDIKLYKSGLILRYPHPGNPNEVGAYEEQELLYNAFSEANRWGQLTNVNFVCDLNEKIIYEDAAEMILMQEALHEKKISAIADMILERKARVVLICGPSSSGKTTFAKRLCIQVCVNGLKTQYMGTDDYYKEYEERVYDENGEVDLESIRAIDTVKFMNDINNLLKGEEVDLPRYDFSIPGKVYGERITKLKANQIIVIEGIHAMNDELTFDIPEEEKFKIYISPFTPISIDHHNRISTTDARMLRRLVRDHKFRNAPAERTISMWPKVRSSEDINIFPYNSKADVFFNSNCIYELSVLKKYAEPLLKRIKRNEPEYGEAQRMLSFLKYIDPLYDDSFIPNNSIIREFIGGSVIVK
ncbi:MAG: ATP-binding protein [Erysipelotrichaceae bacterium]|nr:ATP-binding protein [Erysipelotrichaceae bacterium]